MPEYARALVWVRRDPRDCPLSVVDHAVQSGLALALFKQASQPVGGETA
jgi:hypothetical protein